MIVWNYFYGTGYSCLQLHEVCEDALFVEPGAPNTPALVYSGVATSTNTLTQVGPLWLFWQGSQRTPKIKWNG